MNSFWDTVILMNTVRTWCTAIGIALAIMLAARIIQQVILIRIKKVADRTSSTIDDFILKIIQRSGMPLVYLAAVYVGSNYLNMLPIVQKIVHAAFMTVAVFFVIRALGDLLSYIFQRFTHQADAHVKQARGILLIIKIVLWMGGVVFLLDNFGYNITTIVAGLGIGGIAIALAAQAVLGDLFSYLVIFFDKPFEVGDFIQLDDKSGTVEYIGIKTTRLRTLSGEQLILSNTDLTNSRVQNFKRMETRRVLLTIKVAYDTGVEKLRKIPGLLKEIIEAQPQVKFDRAHFSGFGEFSLNFELVYYLLNADYLLFMDSQQDLLLKLYERFEKESIELAYPTQKLLLHNEQKNGHDAMFNKEQLKA